MPFQTTPCLHAPSPTTLRNLGYYCVDTRTGKRTSLGKLTKREANDILHAKNQAERQPTLNLQIAKAYLAGTDAATSSRTWRDALEAITDSKHGTNLKRWKTVAKDPALADLLPRVIIETQGEMLLKAIQNGCVSTNIFLRRLHNFCVDMNWLAWPLLPKRQWPPVRFKEKRAITWEEHSRIIERERNPERRAFYQLAWHLGASQSDLAMLEAEDVDWNDRIISFFRMKTKWRGGKDDKTFVKSIDQFIGDDGLTLNRITKGIGSLAQPAIRETYGSIDRGFSPFAQERSSPYKKEVFDQMIGLFGKKSERCQASISIENRDQLGKNVGTPRTISSVLIREFVDLIKENDAPRMLSDELQDLWDCLRASVAGAAWNPVLQVDAENRDRFIDRKFSNQKSFPGS